MEAISTDSKVSSKSRIKYLIVALVLALSYYVYASQHSSTHYSIEHYFGMLEALKKRSITNDELKLGAHHLAVSLCKNTKLQQSSGNSVNGCMTRLELFSHSCQTIVFNKAGDEFSELKDATSLTWEYASCTGVIWSPMKGLLRSPRSNMGTDNGVKF